MGTTPKRTAAIEGHNDFMKRFNKEKLDIDAARESMPKVWFDAHHGQYWESLKEKKKEMDANLDLSLGIKI